MQPKDAAGLCSQCQRPAPEQGSELIARDLLEWHDWTPGDEVSASVPLDEWLLVEIRRSGVRENEFRTGRFYRSSQEKVTGVVGDAFYFDRQIVRFASIQHLLPGPSMRKNEPTGR